MAALIALTAEFMRIVVMEASNTGRAKAAVIPAISKTTVSSNMVKPWDFRAPDHAGNPGIRCGRYSLWVPLIGCKCGRTGMSLAPLLHRDDYIVLVPRS